MGIALKDIVILGGPNGAGKTTAAQVLLPKSLRIREFVNADEIARGLSPFNPDAVALAAGRLMIQRLRSLVSAEVSFAFETTCSGRLHADWLRRCKIDGWRITLLYLWLPSIEMAQARVSRRVTEGGHGIPPDVVARRYLNGIRNMRHIYLELADVAAIYDNADEERVLIAERWEDGFLAVHDATRWQTIEGQSR